MSAASKIALGALCGAVMAGLIFTFGTIGDRGQWHPACADLTTAAECGARVAEAW